MMPPFAFKSMKRHISRTVKVTLSHLFLMCVVVISIACKFQNNCLRQNKFRQLKRQIQQFSIKFYKLFNSRMVNVTLPNLNLICALWE